MKAVKTLLISMSVLVLIYFAGPYMPDPVLSINLPTIQGSVENYVSSLEDNPTLKIRPGCRARIIWANDSTKQATENVLLYLHGFSASWREGYPVNEEFAKRYGCNAFFARLAAHGEISENPLLDMTPERLYESAKEALVIAHQLGQKVIIMGCSTGCTLALKLAADFPNLVDGMILYSPNVQIKNKTAVLLSGHWGLQIAQLNFGGKFRVLDDDPNGDICKYWNCVYRAEATVYLQQLLDATMNKEQFAKVKCPVFMGYYYKDEQNQDDIVEVKASLKMFKELGTPEGKKRAVDFPNAGNHVLCSPLLSGAVPEVRNATFQFAEEILGMKSIQ
ncbi:MAG: alpha/beta fold hydrolase [Prolixibacteraceae bacterium]|nr:alpha/beta fold hydrolase [Prolixibacteraceae bacterium]